jgi:chromate reductase
MTSPTTIGVVACSLRKASANRGLARNAAAQLGEGATLLNIDSLPLFSEDHEVADSEPTQAEGAAWRAAVRNVDCLLICTPEYDSYPPAMTLNALNWLSRAPEPPLKDKLVAVCGAAAGFRGARRSQAHVREVLDRMGARTVEAHFQLQIGDRFNSATGDLTDPEAIQDFGRFLTSVKSAVEDARD